jgi:hypothetical protein
LTLLTTEKEGQRNLLRKEIEAPHPLPPYLNLPDPRVVYKKKPVAKEVNKEHSSHTRKYTIYIYIYIYILL